MRVINPFFDYDRTPPDIPDDAEFDQVDQYGRRFRKVGNIVEYEPEINGVPRSVFFASQKAQKIADEERRKRENEAMRQAQTNRDCPFKVGRNQVKTSCEKDCPFYDGGCVLANAPTTPTTDTNGKYCPIAGRCHDRCALYDHGCKLIQIFKCMKHGKE